MFSRFGLHNCTGSFWFNVQVSVTAWCLHRKGPLFVAMFHPLSIIIAAVIGIIFLGDVLYLGRSAIDDNPFKYHALVIFLHLQLDEDDMTEFVRGCPSEFKEYYIQMQVAKRTQAPHPSQAGTKLLCAVLSLRVPSKSSQPCGEQATSMNSRSLPDYLEQRAIQKLLLIGYNGSETSTIFKQARVLYKDAPFSEDEHEHIKLVIQSHVYSYIGTLLEGRERFEEESLNELRQKQSCDGLSSTLAGTKYI
ncbi:extra-large guanine nucleotide-binding protein 1 [Phtheirospermum japonicum]|uniref:Extra-large guanine nucleotide-binding protein 1 n=1 Tax=Phtheirospermum japonicum TaxID=374723 RepID=A0A830BEB0_9LAMI|nr:extra-large guanine nucleotide-binding protein 1 [Phtheirospermum japonicum]